MINKMVLLWGVHYGDRQEFDFSRSLKDLYSRDMDIRERFKNSYRSSY